MKNILFISVLLISNLGYAETYSMPEISHIYADPTGNVLIKWSGSPMSSHCGSVNHGWVSIPATAPEIQKALALSTYFSGKPARINTSGCERHYEKVIGIYSPGG